MEDFNISLGMHKTHEPGNKKCEGCWEGYPREHKVCGGLIHAEFASAGPEGTILSTKCDKCGYGN